MASSTIPPRPAAGSTTRWPFGDGGGSRRARRPLRRALLAECPDLRAIRSMWSAYVSTLSWRSRATARVSGSPPAWARIPSMQRSRTRRAPAKSRSRLSRRASRSARAAKRKATRRSTLRSRSWRSFSACPAHVKPRLSSGRPRAPSRSSSRTRTSRTAPRSPVGNVIWRTGSSDCRRRASRARSSRPRPGGRTGSRSGTRRSRPRPLRRRGRRRAR